MTMFRLVGSEMCISFFFFQAEDGIRDFCLSRGLGDVYKRQGHIQKLLLPYPTIIQVFS